MKHFSLLIAAFALAMTQCERHPWEDVKDADGHVTDKGTKRLYGEHGEHADKDGAAHGNEGAGDDKDAEKDEGAGEAHDGDGKADH
jgi:hypothetical protein